MLEFKKRVLTFNYEGEKYEVNYPTVKQVKDHANRSEKKDADQFELVFDFLSELGLPKEVAENMEQGHIQTIVSNITDSRGK